VQLIGATIQRVRKRAGGQGGFTMITTILMLFVVGLASVAAIAAANGDIRLTRYDQDGKEANAAAEAGINDYFAHLQQDPDYWTRCAGEDPTKPLAADNDKTGVNQPQDRGLSGLPARRWRDVSGANSQYSIELIPADPAQGKKCDTADPVGSMIDDDGNFTIRSTGRIKGISSTNNYKAVVATFRRTGFLDFIYFTDLENQDPTYLTLNFDDVATRETTSNGTPTGGPDLATWAGDKCEHHWWGTQPSGEGRAEMPAWHGQYQDGSGNWVTSTGFDLTTAFVCGEITFASDDQVNGPFHSNDDILVSGTPDFGRTTNKDRVEVANVASSDQGWRGYGASPVFHTPTGKLTTLANSLDLPPSNATIKAEALSGYLYTGPTTITLNGTANTMNVTTNGTTTNNVPVPSNGVIYVKNSACTYGYKPTDTTSIDPGCGVVKVSGTYNKDLTIAAEDDVIVTDNLKRDPSTNAVLGLVAQNFVRVWHPVDRDQSGCPNTGTLGSIQIDAAILSLKHSFTVDNFSCGVPLGTLTVNGAIAQKHRGIVGTGGSSITHGYIKNYNYDDRLRSRSPPFFLDPVQAAWRILRANDQSGAK
jgi:type II secretory pathway pseudopilin PulG